MRYITQVEDKAFEIEVQDGKIVVDGQIHDVDLRHVEPLSLYSLLIDNLSHEILIEEQQDAQFGAMLQGQLYTVDVREKHACERDRSCAAPTDAKKESHVAAPMPGLVLEVLVDVGQAMRSGDVAVVLESMKMRTELRSPQDGTVRAVHVSPQDHVSHGQVLVTIAADVEP